MKDVMYTYVYGNLEHSSLNSLREDLKSIVLKHINAYKHNTPDPNETEAETEGGEGGAKPPPEEGGGEG